MALKAVIYGPVLISVTEVISFAAGIRVIAVLVSWSLPVIIEGFPNERHIHHSRRHSRRDHRCRPRKKRQARFFSKSLSLSFKILPHINERRPQWIAAEPFIFFKSSSNQLRIHQQQN